MEKVYDSFYMTVILCSRNTTNKKESSFQIKRKTAHPNIIDDFITIFDEYKNPNLQILANIKILILMLILQMSSNIKTKHAGLFLPCFSDKDFFLQSSKERDYFPF